MESLICPHDGAENLAIALRCTQCSSRLSRVVVGSEFANRYQIDGLHSQTDSGFLYVGRMIATGKPCILREIVPDQPAQREDQTRFNRAAIHLIDSRPDCLIPIFEHFAQQSRYYIVGEWEQKPTLFNFIDNKESLPEAEAERLFGRMISGLAELYA